MSSSAAATGASWRPLAGPLAAEVAGAGPRLVFVHGFTQTRRSWLPVAEHFVRHYQVMLVDAPGHGGSSGIRADLRRGADLLAATGGRATYIGYSMGGRLCLHLALAYPHHVDRLVLLGATAGILDDDERLARRQADHRLAAEIERDGVEPFIERWLATPLFAHLALDSADIASRIHGNSAAGLASSLRLAGTGEQLPLWDRLAELGMPTLILAGEHDTKFTALGQHMADLIGDDARFATIHRAGHAAHLEQPTQVITRLEAFLGGVP